MWTLLLRWLSPFTNTTLNTYYILRKETYMYRSDNKMLWTLSRHELHSPSCTWATLICFHIFNKTVFLFFLSMALNIFLVLNFHFKCLKRHCYRVESKCIWSCHCGIWNKLAMVQMLALLPTSSITWTNNFTCTVLWSHINKVEVIILLTSESCYK